VARKDDRTILRHQHVGLDVDTDTLVGNVNAGFVDDDDPRLQRQVVVTDITHIEAEEVAGTVDEILAVAGFVHDSLGRQVHVAVVIRTDSHLVECGIRGLRLHESAATGQSCPGSSVMLRRRNLGDFFC